MSQNTQSCCAPELVATELLASVLLARVLLARALETVELMALTFPPAGLRGQHGR
jgi:hypothetical protein